jgi:hypothetical protein
LLQEVPCIHSGSHSAGCPNADPITHDFVITNETEAHNAGFSPNPLHQNSGVCRFSGEMVNAF